MKKKIDLTDPKALRALKAGDGCLLSGVVYTARDAAHKKIFAMLDKGEDLPFDIKDFNVYYAGPSDCPPGRVIGSIGPTTSARMDAFTPRLIALGQRVMIGKGERSEEVRKACGKYGAVYFCATGGCGALLSASVVSAEVVAFPELGCESVKRLVIKDFPAVVGIDADGNTIFR